jgi:hypothetical protein
VKAAAAASALGPEVLRGRVVQQGCGRLGSRENVAATVSRLQELRVEGANVDAYSEIGHGETTPGRVERKGARTSGLVSRSAHRGLLLFRWIGGQSSCILLRSVQDASDWLAVLGVDWRCLLYAITPTSSPPAGCPHHGSYPRHSAPHTQRSIIARTHGESATGTATTTSPL